MNLMEQLNLLLRVKNLIGNILGSLEGSIAVMIEGIEEWYKKTMHK